MPILLSACVVLQRTMLTSNRQETRMTSTTMYIYIQCTIQDMQYRLHLGNYGMHNGTSHFMDGTRTQPDTATVLLDLKDKTTTRKSTNVVYKITCNDCLQYYVKITGRKLGTSLKEHQAALRPHGKTLLVQGHTT